MDSVALAVATIHLAICPFTKVEESFNIQAMHDLLYYTTNISDYDHLEFPGVVPRTFVGPLIISILSSPFYFVLEHFEVSKFSIQLLVRCVLGASVIFTWTKYKSTIEYLFGEGVARWLLILTISQFHFMFYLSRTLPNIMALPFVMIALHAWLRKQHTLLLTMSAISVVIFRSELVLFLGLLVLFELFYLRLSITRLIVLGIPIGMTCLAVTVAIDSYFWQRMIWPEGEVLYFNTVLNRSSDYGTHPFFWYFYSAIPRAMGMSLFLIPSSLVWDKRIRRLITPALLFVFAYSFLPHKELRFIIYVLPVLNVAAAYTCNLVFSRRTNSFLHKCVALGIVLHVLMNFVITYFLLSISSKNYPGGVAISILHKIESPHEAVNVHIDNYAAQTGVTRFTQLNPTWRYNKTEYLKAGGPDLMSFTHLIVEAKSKYSPNLKPYVQSHNIIAIVETFSHLQFSYLNYLYNIVKIKTKPSLFILKRKDLIKDTSSPLENDAQKLKSKQLPNEDRGKSKDQSKQNLEDEFVFNFEEEEGDDIKDETSSRERSETPVIQVDQNEIREPSKPLKNIIEEVKKVVHKQAEKVSDTIKKVNENDDPKSSIKEKSEAPKSKVEDTKIDVDKSKKKTIQKDVKEKQTKTEEIRQTKDKLEDVKLEESVKESIGKESVQIHKESKDKRAESKQINKEKLNSEVKEKIKEKIIHLNKNSEPVGRGESLKANDKSKSDERSKGEFRSKNGVDEEKKEDVCMNCNENSEAEIEIVEEETKVKASSIRDDIKKKIMKYKLKEKLEHKSNGGEEWQKSLNHAEFISSDEFVNVEDE